MSADQNRVVLTGTVTAVSKRYDSEDEPPIVEVLLTVRTDNPHRVDVLPVTVEPAPPYGVPYAKGSRVTVMGSLQRRIRQAGDGRRTRLEVVADEIRVEEVHKP